MSPRWKLRLADINLLLCARISTFYTFILQALSFYVRRSPLYNLGRGLIQFFDAWQPKFWIPGIFFLNSEVSIISTFSNSQWTKQYLTRREKLLKGEKVIIRKTKYGGTYYVNGQRDEEKYGWRSMTSQGAVGVDIRKERRVGIMWEAQRR